MIYRKTAGNFDKNDNFIFFNAGGVSTQQIGYSLHRYILVAINEITPSAFDKIKTWLLEGTKIFIDSGIFNLAMEHVRKTGITHDEALSLPPNKIIGFDELWEKYIAILTEVGDKAWGYIEMDQGGKENKILLRAKLEKLGLSPIPVYHPFLDGWDYFDYLAERYDRICFGNVVQANAHTRMRLVATAWERKQKYPNLWIHLLGYSPNEVLNAFPINSADSSTWLSNIRWSGVNERTDGKSIGSIYRNFQYKLGENISDIGCDKSVAQSACSVHIHQLNWRAHIADIMELIK